MITTSTRMRNALAQLSPSVWRILAHSMLFGLAASITDLLFNFYLVSLGYANDTAGLFSTISRSAGLVFGLPVGVLIDRIGARRSLISGLVMYMLAWVALLLSPTLWAMIVAQFVVGTAFILAVTALTPLMAGVVHDGQRTQLFGLNASASNIIGPVGSIIAGLLPTLIARAIGGGPQDVGVYRLALASSIVLTGCAALPVLRRFPVLAADPHASPDAPERPMLSFWQVLRLSWASLLMGVSGGLLLPFQNLFFRGQFGLSDAAVGAVLASSALGLGLGGLLGVPLGRRLGLRRAAGWLRMAAAPAMLVMMLPLLLPATLGYFLRGLFIGASYPLNDSLVMLATPPRQRGLAASLMSVLWSAGWAGAALISGWVQLRWGFTPILLAAALAYVGSSLSILVLRVDGGD